jgi:hypothetical protein
MYFFLPITGEQNCIILSIFSNPNIFGEMQNFEGTLKLLKGFGSTLDTTNLYGI